MAHTKFPVEVLTPEGEVFAEEVERSRPARRSARSASWPTTAAAGDARSDRAAALPLRVRRRGFAQAEGYLQVTGDRVLLLVEEAHEPDSLDAGDLRERLDRAERELDEAGEDSERRRVAERDKRRLEAFLRIAEGG